VNYETNSDLFFGDFKLVQGDRSKELKEKHRPERSGKCSEPV
jgi:hypothetical protein